MKLKELPRSYFIAWKLMRIEFANRAQVSSQDLPLIVSLTSIPERLHIIHLTIRSLLVQSHRPEKIVLWLNHQLRNNLPEALASLQSSLFEIRYVDLTCSHRKLIHSLEAYPERTIVTCDDDLMYNSTWLKRLYDDHLHFPKDIIAHECRHIKFDNLGEPLPYDQWKTESRTNYTDKWLMPIGYGGVLYPSGCLYSDVLRSDLFLQLTPKADDLWFKAMSYLASTATRRSSNPGEKPVPIIGSQKVSLKKSNVREDGNLNQWRALCEHYHFIGSP